MPQLRRDATTALRFKPDAPQISIKSPFAGFAHMGDIILEGDPYFVKHGAILVEMGSIELYRSVLSGEKLNPPQIKVQTSGRLWDQNDRLNVWIWSRTGDTVQLSMWVNVDLRPVPPTSAVLPPNRLELVQFAPDQQPLPNTAQEFIEYVKQNLHTVRQRDIAADLASWTTRGFDLKAREAMLPRLSMTNPELHDRLEALHETLPIPGYAGPAIFPTAHYTDVQHTRLVHMRGARNLLLTLSYDPVRPRLVANMAQDPFEPPVWRTSPGTNAIRHNFNTYTYELADSGGPRQVRIRATANTVVRVSGGTSAPIPGANPGDRAQYHNYRASWTGAQRTLTVYGGPTRDGPWTRTYVYQEGVFAKNPSSWSWDEADFAHKFIQIRCSSTELFTMTQIDSGPRAVYPDPPTIEFTTQEFNPGLTQVDVHPTTATNPGEPRIKFQVRDAESGWADLTDYIAWPYDSNAIYTEQASPHLYGQDLGNSVLPTGPDVLRLFLDADRRFNWRIHASIRPLS